MSRRRSRAMVRSTREPSRKVRRWLSPWIRGLSNEATSTTRRPAARARTFRNVSTSKPGTPGVEGREHVPPEGHVAVAEVGVAAAEGDPDRLGQHEVAERPQRGQVAAAAALHEAGALGHVGAGDAARRRRWRCRSDPSTRRRPSSPGCRRGRPRSRTGGRRPCRAGSSSTMVASGRSSRTTSSVPSVDPPSTITSSSTTLGSVGSTWRRFSASFSVGMIRRHGRLCRRSAPHRLESAVLASLHSVARSATTIPNPRSRLALVFCSPLVGIRSRSRGGWVSGEKSSEISGDVSAAAARARVPRSGCCLSLGLQPDPAQSRATEREVGGGRGSH